LRGLRQPIGGREADHVFRFLLALIVSGAILFFVLDLPHEFSHLWGSGNAANARRSSCLSNLRQVSFAIDMYCADNNQRLWPRPATPEPLPRALFPYVKTWHVFVCPSDPSRPRQPHSTPYTSYATNDLLLGLPLERVQGEPFAWDREPWHSNVRNVLTIGNSPKWVREKDFDRLGLVPMRR
jgi:hypothetical protein